MERYYQLVENLAEWFMQFFFDPAYHFVSNKGSNQKPKKSKLKEALEKLYSNSVNTFSEFLKGFAANALVGIGSGIIKSLHQSASFIHSRLALFRLNAQWLH